MRHEPTYKGMTPPSYTYTRHAYLKSSSGRLEPYLHTPPRAEAFSNPRYRVKLYSPKPQTNGFDTTLWENPRGETPGRSQTMRHEPTYKGMTPPSTQNLKALGLWVFFLICCSTFSFLPNVGLKLTLEYLTILKTNMCSYINN